MKNEKSLEELINDLKIAYRECILILADELRIPQFLEWLTNKINKL